MESLRCPLLLLHGGADPVNALAGAQRLFEKARSADKQLIVYEHNLHEPFHDTAQSQAIEDVCSWVRARVRAQGIDVGR